MNVYYNLDGTLTKHLGFDTITRDVLLELGVAEHNIDIKAYTEAFFNAFNDFKPRPREHAFEKYAEKLGVDVDAEKAASLYKDKEYARSQPRPTLKQALRRTTEQALTGVITAGTTELQRRKIRKLGINSLLDDIKITYDEQRQKQDIFKAIKANTDDDFFYVSNNTTDIDEARGAGWKTFHGTVEDYDPPVEVSKLIRFQGRLAEQHPRRSHIDKPAAA